MSAPIRTLLVPIGTRPEIIKLAPVVAALRAAGIGVRTVATGQHHDPALSQVFHDELGLHPDVTWQLPAGEAERVGEILRLAFDEVADSRPDAVLVLGDTYTVPLLAMAARRHGVPVIHLEAGLRSGNPRSMEEVNRRIAAATASLHLAPTDLAAQFLRAEGIAEERIAVVGNPVIDALRLAGVQRRDPGSRAGVVVTAHRATNVDDPARLTAIVELIVGLQERLGPVSFPVHPRTGARLQAAGLDAPLRAAGVRLLEPLPWRPMLELLAGSLVAVTDSGGLQEEASWLGVPTVVLRHSTPRWEGVRLGAAVLTGVDPAAALAAATAFATPEAQARVAALPCPYGDGHTAERVVELLTDPARTALLRLDEPTLVPC